MTEEDEIAKELQTLGPYDEPATPRKRQQSSLTELDEDRGFEFDAITSYGPDGEVDGCFLHKEMVDMPMMKEGGELGQRITQMTELWEGKKGLRWQDAFKHTGNSLHVRHCVTKKMMGGKTQWRKEGYGKYACKDCVCY